MSYDGEGFRGLLYIASLLDFEKKNRSQGLEVRTYFDPPRGELDMGKGDEGEVVIRHITCAEKGEEACGS